MDKYKRTPSRVERIFYKRGTLGEHLEARRHRFTGEVEIKCNDVWAHADPTHWGDFVKEGGEISEETKGDLDWLIKTPSSTMASKYHDAESCWRLIEVALSTIREQAEQIQHQNKKAGEKIDQLYTRENLITQLQAENEKLKRDGALSLSDSECSLDKFGHCRRL